MAALLIGYARVSTDQQDLTAQREAPAALGVSLDRTYVDHGLTGTNRERPGLREALAACRAGDTLVVTKLDRLARSLPDAREILDDLTKREVKLSLGGSVHDPTDPVGRLLFNSSAGSGPLRLLVLLVQSGSLPLDTADARFDRPADLGHLPLSRDAEHRHEWRSPRLPRATLVTGGWADAASVL